MKIYLGLTFTAPPLPPPAPEADNEIVLNPNGLLRLLETFYALGQPNINRDALRTEQFRQIVVKHLELWEEGSAAMGAAAGAGGVAIVDAPPFYEAAFRADAFATAEELLSRRDELLAAGYDLSAEPAEVTPPRLATLHELEELLLTEAFGLELTAGPADRLNRLLADIIYDRRHPKLSIYLNEPEELLPVGLRRLLRGLVKTGDQLTHLPPAPAPAPAPTTDLDRWKQSLTNGTAADKPPLTGDGSLVLLRAERETHIAAYLARVMRDNATWRPGILMTVRNQTLDNALQMEGLPSLGVPSTSLARPSLQVLKLVTTFLWEPPEVQRIMEFVSLVTKPLEDRLARNIARYLSDTPGLFGPSWYGMIERVFREMAERNWPDQRIRNARIQYNFWFGRDRYPRDGRVPKEDVRALFVYLRNWSREGYDEDDSQTGLLVLAAQSERAVELLDAHPEDTMNYLDVERLVRTIYQPAPTQFTVPERGAPPVTYDPASCIRLPEAAGQPPLDRLLWWDFVEQEPDYFFSRYYPEELDYLRELGCEPDSPQKANELRLWQHQRPVLHTARQLVLCLPTRVDGTAIEPHPLMGDLEAAFAEGSLAKITIDIDALGHRTDPLSEVTTPDYVGVPIKALDRPVPQLKLAQPEVMQPREQETPTALEDLLYYPHKWVFRHLLELRGTPILSIASENRLRGNLSHLFVEELLNAVATSGKTWSRGEVTQWIESNARALLRQQGAVLLEYGQEPERVQFVRTMQYSAWSLLDYIQKNNWTIRQTEEEVAGELVPMGGQPVRGRADLVLERRGTDGKPELAVVDLKWRGKTVFRNLLRNAEDVQLCLYAEFLRQGEGANVHTCYYVLRDSLMLSRNELAFANIETVTTKDDYKVVQRETLSKIQATYNWRWEQFAEGAVEVRCEETLPYLEDLYLDQDHDSLLPMKSEDSKFDDYRSLIGLVR